MPGNHCHTLTPSPAVGVVLHKLHSLPTWEWPHILRYPGAAIRAQNWPQMTGTGWLYVIPFRHSNGRTNLQIFKLKFEQHDIDENNWYQRAHFWTITSWARAAKLSTFEAGTQFDLGPCFTIPQCLNKLENTNVKMFPRKSILPRCSRWCLNKPMQLPTWPVTFQTLDAISALSK